jgi:hypothetical protein
MTRPPVDAVPILARGDHRPSASCPCQPIEASDLLEPSVVVRIHRALPDPRDAPPEADRLLWRSREQSTGRVAQLEETA